MEFTKRDTLAAKGAAIAIMYVHHMFLSPERYGGFTIDFAPFTDSQVAYVAAFFKICVGRFVFLSGYGMTMSLKRAKERNSVCHRNMIVRRMTTLMMNYWIIFFLSLVVSVIISSPHSFQSVYGGGKKGLWYCALDFLGLADLYQTPTFNATWWYMSLAILIIFLMPLLYQFWSRYSYCLLGVVLLLPRALDLPVTNITRWGLALVLGIICADTNLLGRLKGSFAKSSRLVKLLAAAAMTGVMLLFVIMRQSPIGSDFIDVFDSVIPAYAVAYVSILLTGIPGVGAILVFLGRHSMNLFMFHTFFRDYFWKKYIYGFKCAWLDLLLLFVSTLLVSIVLEQLKKRLGFYRLIDRILKKTITTDAVPQRSDN